METTILNSTLEAIEAGRYDLADKTVELRLAPIQYEQAKCLLPEDVYDLFDAYTAHKKRGSACYVHVDDKDSFEAAAEMYNQSGSDSKVAVLNFANPVTPGGGVRRGAKAQEETLCLRSTLLKSLESAEATKYYDYNRALRTYGGSDAVILSDNVEVIRDKQYNYLENSFVVSVITCAAPMVSPISHRLEDRTQEEMEALLYRRILCILIAAICHGYQKLVLGAWGCGAFGNDAVTVAKLFREAFEAIGVDSFFEEICFAILDRGNRYNLDAFLRYFGND